MKGSISPICSSGGYRLNTWGVTSYLLDQPRPAIESLKKTSLKKAGIIKTEIEAKLCLVPFGLKTDG
jgi:hypothetical protein